MIAYQNYITTPISALPKLLLEQGYSCSVFHPYYNTGYSRNVVYPLLGFESFGDIATLENLNFIRYGNYTDDLSTYQNIIKLFENKEKDEKIFNFTVTMQNHSPYNSDKFSNNVYLNDFNKEDYSEINQYLSLIKLSDSAFEYLVNYFSNVEEKTIILMFGDHQPGFVNSYPEVFGNQSGSYNEDNYIVPFIIWANYDIEETAINDISMNYLSNVLLDYAGLPKSTFIQFLNKLYDKYPVITDNIIIDASGNAINNSENLNDNSLKLYEFLQYNLLFDEKNRLYNIFEIKNAH